MIENIRFTSLITKDQSTPPWFTHSFDRHIKSFGDNLILTILITTLRFIKGIYLLLYYGNSYESYNRLLVW